MTEPLRFSCQAMNTKFEIIFSHGDSDYLSQAAETCFEELDRLEKELSRFISTSDVSRFNGLSPKVPTTVGLETWDCLIMAREIWKKTQGAFDPVWNSDKRSGMEHLILIPDKHALAKDRPGLSLDLGGIGKGFAVDHIASILDDWEIDDALVHGGQSTVLAWSQEQKENKKEAREWKLSLGDAQDPSRSSGQIKIQGNSVSGSGLAVQGAHILDPATGQAVLGTHAAWASAPTAAESDALSTAFMVMKPKAIEALCAEYPKYGACVVQGTGAQSNRLCFGSWKQEKIIELGS